MFQSTDDIVRAAADGGAALLGLPLAELPAIAGLQVRGFVPPPLRVELQLGHRFDAGHLLAWAEVLPAAVATAWWGSGYIHLAVTGRLGGAAVQVWNHILGEGAVAWAAGRLGLPRDRFNRAAVPVARETLRRLAEHPGELSCDG